MIFRMEVSVPPGVSMVSRTAEAPSSAAVEIPDSR
jgi:hypothetical protein